MIDDTNDASDAAVRPYPTTSGGPAKAQMTRLGGSKESSLATGGWALLTRRTTRRRNRSARSRDSSNAFKRHDTTRFHPRAVPRRTRKLGRGSSRVRGLASNWLSRVRCQLRQRLLDAKLWAKVDHEDVCGITSLGKRLHFGHPANPKLAIRERLSIREYRRWQWFCSFLSTFVPRAF